MRRQLFPQPEYIPYFNDWHLFNNARIGVSGGKGVLGSIILQRSQRVGIEAIPFHGDVRKSEDVDSYFKEAKPEYFFHFAAVVPVNRVEANPINAFGVNVIGTYNVAKSIIRNCPTCWLLIASSSHVYSPCGVERVLVTREDSFTDPKTFYGKTKLAAEQIASPLLEKCDVPYCIGRIFSFSHGSQKEPFLVPSILKKIANASQGDEIELFDPDSIRDILDAETVIDCILHLAAMRYRGLINVGSGRSWTIRDIASHLAAAQKKTIRIVGIQKNKPNALVSDSKLLKTVIWKKEN